MPIHSRTGSCSAWTDPRERPSRSRTWTPLPPTLAWTQPRCGPNRWPSWIVWGTYVAPWPVALALGRRVAEVYTEQVLRSIAKDEAELQDKAVHGTIHDFRDGASLRVASERYAERLQSIEAPAFALARQWCGVDAVARFDEVQALREEVVRLRELLRGAISTLEEAGRPGIARRLRSQLGVAATDPYSPRISPR